jgi:hypothetical protein
MVERCKKIRQPFKAGIQGLFHGAKMTKRNTTLSNQDTRRADVSLDSRYGAIGISAVAAALQFKSEAKNPAYAPAVPQLDEERLADEAA